MPAIHYREATPDDAPALGALHVASWRETYAGLLPQEMLDSLSAESRASMWATVLHTAGENAGTKVFIAEAANDLIGFGACGSQRDDTMRQRGFNGEIGAIYVLRSHQRDTVGRSLMSLMAQDLTARHLASGSLWVLRGNMAARRFYEALGGAMIGETMTYEGDAIVHEVAYGWLDIARICYL